MPTIALNTYRLPINQKLIRGQTIIDMSTDNPDVPGNEGSLATFTTAQAELDAANAAYVSAQSTLKALMTAREAAVARWNAAINTLASFTEFATSGIPGKVLSAGFDIRSAKSPPTAVGEIIEVRVSYTGTPGYSQVTWKRDPYADAYRVQYSPETITDTSWEDLGPVTEATFYGNGATPGQVCWYRIAGINRLGQGQWSMPALRPVM